MNVDQTNRLTELEFLSEDLNSLDKFTSLYEAMLDEATVTKDQEMIRAMQRILFKQGAFLVDEWQREKRQAPVALRVMEYGKNN